ncbi:hypothetical protein [Carboxydothermus pertinax]|uniref:hypothetical protein n=1 Tax=Carboxydothermus pertinax TaxID=870242 RepID=UPI001356312B|nr:hypothetical protein [Carboxydothermus pertinax]
MSCNEHQGFQMRTVIIAAIVAFWIVVGEVVLSALKLEGWLSFKFLLPKSSEA